MKTVVIIGGGPAGITAGYELLKKSDEYQVIILEETNEIGGISRTIIHNGNRMDIGGHRFFSKIDEVTNWWTNLLPIQGENSIDDILLGRTKDLPQSGPDPEQTDQVMLLRNRVSRIYSQKKFFDYPITIKYQTFKNMGLLKTIKVIFSYMKSKIFQLKETSLEDFYINRFGRELYQMFFEGYTEKLWGRHPRDISPEWGAQRVKGLSIIAILKNVIMGLVPKQLKSNTYKETSLIEEFLYPKFGPGQLWETAANEVVEMGGKILKNSKVIRINSNSENKVESLDYECNGEIRTLQGDVFISSMPLKDLVMGMNDVPEDMIKIAAGLPYRDFITVGLLVNRLNLKNETNIKTLGNIVPDCWIYVQDDTVKLGRIQIFNNWSPYMVKSPEETVWLGLEYFCNEDDDFWNRTDEENISFAVKELMKMGVILGEQDILDSHIAKVKKAYPAYFDTYSEIDQLKQYLDLYENLYLVGRNGQHRYNNMDHSMVTSFEAVKNIIDDVPSKENIWNVNTDQAYHESGQVESKVSFIKKNRVFESVSLIVMMATIALLIYFIVYPARGYFHSDSTDTILWAQASYESKSIFNQSFTYACLQPFGGQLLMIPFIGLFGVSMTTHIIGMILFLILFVASILYLLKTLGWNLMWSSVMVSILLLMLSLSDKLREIFWGHIIYYSQGILFLFIGLSLVLKTLLTKKFESEENDKNFSVNLVLIFLWVALCSTNGIQSLIIFVIPTMIAIVGERFLNFDIKLGDRQNFNTYKVALVMLIGMITGYALGLDLSDGIVAGYESAYSSYSDPSSWMENLFRFFPQWNSLLGVEVYQGDKFMTVNGLMNLIKITTNSILVIAPIIMGLMYKKIKDRGIRILILVHISMTMLIMFGYVFGLLSSATWRLSPIVCTSTFMCIVFSKWIIERSNVKRMALFILLPIIIVTASGAYQIAKMPSDYNLDKGLYALGYFLLANDLNYGYGSFWNANALTVLSNSEIKSRGVSFEDKSIVPYYYQSQKSWFDNQANQDRYFLIATNAEYEKMIANDYPLIKSVEEHLEFQDYIILVFDSNIF